QILALVNEAITLPRRGAVGPEVRAPQQHRRLGQRRVTLNLVADQPADDEGTLVSIRLRVEPAGAVTRINPAAEIDDPEVREPRLRVIDDRQRVAVELLAVLGQLAAWPHVGQLNPGDLDLLGRYTGGGQALFRYTPGPGLRRHPLGHRLAALGAIHDGE